MNRDEIKDVVFTGVLLAAITLVHFFHAPGRVEYHALYRVLYFLPVIFASFRFGLKGGIVTPLIASVLYFPDIILYVGRIPPEQIPLVLDVFLFNAIGWITGVMSQAEQRQKRRYRALAMELTLRMAEKRELEEQVRRADKLAALGELVSGVAHEIRNPLGILRTTAQVMEKEYAGDPNALEYVGVIKEEADRINRVIKDFLGFARPARMQFEELDVPAALDEVAGLVSRYAAEHKVNITIEAEPDLPAVMADAHSLKQAFINLIFNAVEAMGEGGDLGIRVWLNGAYLAITFADTGPGIRPEHRKKIFDPFFTTKETGTGLGLAVVHRIMDAHGGYIEVESEVGRGTEITLNLPLENSPGVAPE